MNFLNGVECCVDLLYCCNCCCFCCVLVQPVLRGKLLLILFNQYSCGFFCCVAVQSICCSGSEYSGSARVVMGGQWKILISPTKRCWRRRRVFFAKYAFRSPLFFINRLYVSRFCHRWPFSIVFLVVVLPKSSGLFFSVFALNVATSDLRTVTGIFTGSFIVYVLSSFSIVEPGATTSNSPCRSFFERMVAGIFFVGFSWSDSSVRGMPWPSSSVFGPSRLVWSFCQLAILRVANRTRLVVFDLDVTAVTVFPFVLGIEGDPLNCISL